MVVSDNFQAVYLGFPPKTGVTSMTRFFQTSLNGKLIGKNQHHRIIPNRCKNYLKIACCRNPYSLLVSAWAYWNQKEIPDGFFAKAYALKEIARERKFGDFITLNFKNQILPSQHRILKHLNYANGTPLINKDITILKLENIVNELKKINLFRPNDSDIPHLNFSIHKEFSSYYDKKIESMVYDQYQEDFLGYKYERWEGFPIKLHL